MKTHTKKLIKYSRPLLSLAVLVVFILSLLFVLYRPKAHAQIFLTTGTTWTVPGDWNNTNNSIEAIGGGGGAGSGFSDSSGSGGEGGGGGGAGGYSKITNVNLVPGATVTVAIGAAGTGGTATAGGLPGNSGTAGTDTYLCNSTSNCTSITDSAVVVGAKGAAGGAPGAAGTPGAGGSGGQATSGVGSVKFNGGTGGTGGPTASAAGGGGGGGGGAGGASNNGNNGTNGGVGTNTNFGPGGQGDGTSGGAGGATNGAVGSNGTEYDGSHGSGGGGAGGNGIGNGSGTSGGNGGTYGAGGGAGGGNGSKHGTGGNGGNAQQGLIRITYSFVSQSNYRFRSDDGNETTGTSLAAQDSQASITSTNAFRLRFLITNSGDTTTDTYRVEYAPYSFGCGSWTAVPVSPTTEAFNMFNTSNFTSGTASTNVTSGPAVITDPSGGSFVAGALLSTANSTSVTLSSNQFTEIEYSMQANSNATNPAYCFRLTNAGTALDNYASYPILNINYPPLAPTIYSVTDGSTNTTRLPVYQLRSADYNNDYLQYQVELCLANSWPCSSGTITFTTSDACWQGYNANSDADYSAGTVERDSQMGVCNSANDSSSSQITAHLLAPNTNYFMRAKAIDPGGSNSFGPYSAVQSFTTGNLDIQINGGTCIGGVGSACTSGSGGGGIKIGG
jgi:hypothetical protein